MHYVHNITILYKCMHAYIRSCACDYTKTTRYVYQNNYKIARANKDILIHVKYTFTAPHRRSALWLWHRHEWICHEHRVQLPKARGLHSARSHSASFGSAIALPWVYTGDGLCVYFMCLTYCVHMCVQCGYACMCGYQYSKGSLICVPLDSWRTSVHRSGQNSPFPRV